MLQYTEGTYMLYRCSLQKQFSVGTPCPKYVAGVYGTACRRYPGFSCECRTPTDSFFSRIPRCLSVFDFQPELRLMALALLADRLGGGQPGPRLAESLQKPSLLL